MAITEPLTVRDIMKNDLRPLINTPRLGHVLIHENFDVVNAFRHFDVLE